MSDANQAKAALQSRVLAIQSTLTLVLAVGAERICGSCISSCRDFCFRLLATPFHQRQTIPAISRIFHPILSTGFSIGLFSIPHSLHSSSIETSSDPMAAAAPPTSTGSVKLDAVKAVVAAQDPRKLSGVDLYSRFAFAGAVCCSVTHGALTPVDV
jgi:hypothetical protein